jgi:hypothetical protein
MFATVTSSKKILHAEPRRRGKDETPRRQDAKEKIAREGAQLFARPNRSHSQLHRLPWRLGVLASWR